MGTICNMKTMFALEKKLLLSNLKVRNKGQFSSTRVYHTPL